MDNYLTETPNCGLQSLRWDVEWAEARKCTARFSKHRLQYRTAAVTLDAVKVARHASDHSRARQACVGLPASTCDT